MPPPLTEPCYRETWGLRWAAFPPSLEAEVDAFFAQAPSDDLFAAGGPDRPLSPRTIATQKDHLRCVASALVRQGHAADAITALTYLVVPAHYRQAILWWFERNEKQVTGYLAQIAYTLKKVAKYAVKLPPDTLAEIEAAYRRVAGRAAPGGAVSHERMKQFDSPQACRAFLAYPTCKITAVLKSDRGSIAEALPLVRCGRDRLSRQSLKQSQRRRVPAGTQREPFRCLTWGPSGTSIHTLEGPRP